MADYEYGQSHAPSSRTPRFWKCAGSALHLGPHFTGSALHGVRTSLHFVCIYTTVYSHTLTQFQHLP